MKKPMLHIFRNTPLGRQNLMQSADFCERVSNLSLALYIPSTPQFTMNLSNNLVHVQLDESYLLYPSTARQHINEILERFNCDYEIREPPRNYQGLIPPLDGDWAVMACPRVISEQSSRIGLGHIGPKVRSIAKYAPFPIFIPGMTFKTWTNITAFFGGSELGALAVQQALALARDADVPVSIHTQLGGTTQEECERNLSKAGLLETIRNEGIPWRLYESGTLEENVYEVPHDSLVVVGAAGHNIIKELVFGSKLEVIQSNLPNPLIIIGPKCNRP